jgi:hypothetical protein
MAVEDQVPAALIHSAPGLGVITPLPCLDDRISPRPHRENGAAAKGPGRLGRRAAR